LNQNALQIIYCGKNATQKGAIVAEIPRFAGTKLTVALRNRPAIKTLDNRMLMRIDERPAFSDQLSAKRPFLSELSAGLTAES
jgi:hypothetical protein